jgi:hypothetical protein
MFAVLYAVKVVRPAGSRNFASSASVEPSIAACAAAGSPAPRQSRLDGLEVRLWPNLLAVARAQREIRLQGRIYPPAKGPPSPRAQRLLHGYTV